jgi:hypothetical protein
VAIRWNWVGRPLGYVLNVCLAGAADLGLLFALLLPGYMKWSEGMIGIALFVVAAVISGHGQFRHAPRQPVAATG